MSGGFFLVSLIDTCCKAIKEAFQPVVPAENWENKELYYKDVNSGMPAKQVMENVKNGKYRAVKKYPEPHRDKNGKIIIENCLLFNSDVKKYGDVQAMKWAEQGKYNLSPAELKKEEERIRKDFERLFKL